MKWYRERCGTHRLADLLWALDGAEGRIGLEAVKKAGCSCCGFEPPHGPSVLGFGWSLASRAGRMGVLMTLKNSPRWPGGGGTGAHL